MIDPLEQKILAELNKGHSKQNILKKLATDENKEDLVWYLNHYPTEKKRKKVRLLNYLLILVILIVTVKKLYFIALVQLNAISINQFSPLLLVELLVPAINFYIMVKIIQWYRQGYQFAAVLSLLALIRPENRIMPDAIMYLVITVLSVFLLFQLFPQQEKLRDPTG
ncbi:hypothetical protein [Candidatus Electrothrix sp.]|uniref:hypothetical protein n=1 Tax=Candidatus Electrothrix sp. TaxID=2170559 RepID=UPI00405650E5